jgi:hypothetical protein
MQDKMTRAEFYKYRDIVLMRFDEFQVKYKIFGGTATCLIRKARTTGDIDLAIELSDENIDRFCKAIEASGLQNGNVVKDAIYEVIAEDGNDRVLGIYPDEDNIEWGDFHIDLCIQLGSHTYDSMPEEEFNDNGQKIIIVAFEYIAKMKTDLHIDYHKIGINMSESRPDDIQDVKAIKEHLEVRKMKGFGDD